MKIVVSANGADLSAEASPIFGRCPIYAFVDTETMAFEAIQNPAIGASSGAGIQAAQFVVERGAQAVVSGNVGPNAFDVLDAAGVAVYLFGGGTIQQAVDACIAGQLSSAGGPSAAAHSGMGRGSGRGTGRGMGSRMNQPAPRPQSQAPPSAPAAPAAGEQELDELKQVAGSLRAQLADLVDRLDRLGKGA